jgi:L-fucose mutarotase/ribose pyranase (RbsD/FucU family)
MLKTIDPLLTPELLLVMATMGHGDELAVVDANFPAASVALRTGHGRVVPLVGVSMPEAVRAVLTLLPLDDFVDTPVRRMASDDSAPDNRSTTGSSGRHRQGGRAALADRHSGAFRLL